MFNCVPHPGGFGARRPAPDRDARRTRLDPCGGRHAMMLAALSFRDLEYVVAIADHLHFGRAAASCSVSQPTLSVQLRKLEHYIGVDIFERTGRVVRVTPRGRGIVRQARVILDEGHRLFEIVHADAPRPLGAGRPERDDDAQGVGSGAACLPSGGPA